MNDNHDLLNSDEKHSFLEEVREAAKEGAKEGAKNKLKNTGLPSLVGLCIIRLLPIFLLIIVIIGGVRAVEKFTGQFDNIKEELTSFESPAESHDLVLEDDGFLGYTVADFADAILGEESRLCKVEVLKQDVVDVATVTDTGLMNWSALTKSQLITYHGDAVYTVDLSKLSKSDIELDEEECVVTVYIPHSQLEPINIQSKDIEFGDVNKGLLAFGDIKLTPEEMAEIQTMAQEKMEEKVNELKIVESADKFAKMSVWDMYQPIINSVAKGYSLEVEFR